MGGNELGVRENTGKWVPELLIDRARFPDGRAEVSHVTLSFPTLNALLEIVRSEEVSKFLMTQAGF